MPGSAEANVSIPDMGSAEASAQSGGKRKFTVSDGAIPAMVATIVEDACGERPARALKPAAKPPIPAPARMARQPTTLLLIPLDNPRIIPRPAYPEWVFIFFA